MSNLRGFVPTCAAPSKRSTTPRNTHGRNRQDFQQALETHGTGLLTEPRACLSEHTLSHQKELLQREPSRASHHLSMPVHLTHSVCGLDSPAVLSDGEDLPSESPSRTATNHGLRDKGSCSELCILPFKGAHEQLLPEAVPQNQ